MLGIPIKRGFTDLEQAFEEVVNGDRVELIVTDREIAKLTATIRAKYNFQLPDSIQIATAIKSNCDAFLTNDLALRKVTEIRAIVVSFNSPTGRATVVRLKLNREGVVNLRGLLRDKSLHPPDWIF
jgi:PIN domain